ncbi:cytoplasmic dynein-like protein 1 intermediate chain 2 [Xylona heveae TC161]|uniref:Cytoplasmic dynein-like protein 1 intermediate chain 2 n=1 Tax=Xylona heveae (strain CBS 132557 / TC161) TaxID=1328760 RepID=A0A165HT42_XYLHT|nr:cytoplasmic dynein-like protein 1 intermediate chain 2 [Xylona heveae TC161]KZF23900.1 cytoplasmic dynein-like protein 1 intermediate chain 2 [Xylona heveae TC161]
MLQQRREEILAKKAKLAELKRQRELRQKEFTANRQNVAETSELVPPSPSRADHRRELEDLITSLVGESRPGSVAQKDGDATPASTTKASRPNSVLSASQVSVENVGTPNHAAQNLSTAPLCTIFDFTPAPVQEITTYSKAVQTIEPWKPQYKDQEDFTSEEEDESNTPAHPSRSSKRVSRREREKDEELRQSLRKEIEEELRALNDEATKSGAGMDQKEPLESYPAATLSGEELAALTSTDEYVDFIERSTKIAEKAVDEYDVLADYTLGGLYDIDDGDAYEGTHGKRGGKLRELYRFWDDRWSKKRMVTDLNFSPKFPELLVASYTKSPSAPHDPAGLVQVWNSHLHDRAEYIFQAQSDILTAKFSPFHPNLIIGGSYSGQILLWDTRAKSHPVQKTPLTSSGHTHPVYSVDIVGTQNANNVISCSTDGVICSWAIDMLSQPQEILELVAPPPTRLEDLSPTCMAFPHADPTYFLVGSEEGTIYACHRYDRAGAKAGIDQRICYRGHAAPVMSVDFHPFRGPIDLGDMVLSSSLDWTAKLWKIRAPAAASAGAVSGTPDTVTPLLEIGREDIIYDAKWSPVKPGVFASVDGSGSLAIWNLLVDCEVPVATAQPRDSNSFGISPKSLNKCAWESVDGKRIATGGVDGAVTVFEVGNELGGAENARPEEWTDFKRLLGKLDNGTVLDGQ